MRKFIHFIVALTLIAITDAFIPRPTSSVDKALKRSIPDSKKSQQSETSTSKQIPQIFRSILRRNSHESTGVTTTKRSMVASGIETDSTPKKIIIAGAPASGKGTQCEKIAAKYGVVHLSTGDMLRAAVAAGTEIGKEAKEYMDSGKLVPDSTMIGIVKDRLKQEDCQRKGWLLDGFPRTEAQARALCDAGISADCFIFLNVPDEVLVERVIGRRTDPVTGKIYHMKFSPPTDEEVIARLQHRSDDTEEKVKVRLQQFHANVEAVKGSYADISVTIDGNQDPKLVTEQIFEAIGSLVNA